MAGLELPAGIENAPRMSSAVESATGTLLAQAEAATGRRCFNCGKRVHNGFRFSFYRAQFVVEMGTRVGILEERIYCVRDECAEAVEGAHAEAHCAEPVEIVWLDEKRGEEPPKLPEAEQATG